MAVAIVGGALLGVGEDLVGLADLLEAGLRAVLLVAVRVELHRQAAEGLLDVFGRGVAFDAEDLVVIALCGCHIQDIVSRLERRRERAGRGCVDLGRVNLRLGGPQRGLKFCAIRCPHPLTCCLIVYMLMCA